MILNDTSLRETFVSITAMFRALAERLEAAASKLCDPGSPVDHELITELQRVREVFIGLAEAALAQARLLGILHETDLAVITSLDDLGTLLDQIDETEQQHAAELYDRERATALMRLILRTRHRDIPDFAPLQEAHRHARMALDAISSPTSQQSLNPRALLEETSPLRALLTTLDPQADLDDDRYGKLTEIIIAAFGTALTGALMRGRVVLDPESPTVVAETETEAPTATQGLKVITASSEADTIAETSIIAVPDDIHSQEPPNVPSTAIDSPLATRMVEDVMLTEATPKASVPTNATAALDDELITIDLEALEPLDMTNSYHEERLRYSLEGTISSLLETVMDGQQPSIDGTKASTLEVSSDGIMPQSQQEVPTSLAHELLVDDRANRAAKIQEIIWQLLASERYGLAYHLARSVEVQQTGKPLLPAALIRAVTLAQLVRYDVGSSATLLKHDFSQIEPLVETEGARQDAIALLHIAATLRPALLAPSTGAAAILLQIPQMDDLIELHEYCQIIADYGKYMQPLDVSALKYVKNKALWQTELEALLQEVEGWTEQANFKTIKYAQASAVWRRWQRNDGLISRLLTPIRQNDISHIAFVRAEADRLSIAEDLYREVKHTDRKELGRRDGDDILGGALTTLKQYTAQAIEFAYRWIVLQENRPGRRPDYFQQQTEHLRKKITQRHPQVVAAIDHLAEQRAPIPLELASGLVCCRRAIEQLRELFDENSTFPSEEADPRYLLHGDLLLSTAIDVDDQWEPVTSGDALECALLELAAHSVRQWEIALDAWSERRDHQATKRIIALLSRNADADPALLARLTRRRDQHVKECREALDRDILETRKQIEMGVAYGLLPEADRLDNISKVQQLETAKDSFYRFDAAHMQLRSIRDEIDGKRDAKIEQVRQRLASSGITTDNPAYTRINAVLTEGDALSADEYINLAIRGQQPPEEQPHTDVFVEFFPRLVRALDRLLNDAAVATRAVKEIEQLLRARARNQKGSAQYGQLNFTEIAGAQADQAADLLEAWFEARNTRRLSQQLANQIFGGLGFGTPSWHWSNKAALPATRSTHGRSRTRASARSGNTAPVHAAPISFSAPGIARPKEKLSVIWKIWRMATQYLSSTLEA